MAETEIPYEHTLEFRRIRRELRKERIKSLQKRFEAFGKDVPEGHYRRNSAIEDIGQAHLFCSAKRFWIELLEAAPLSDQRRRQLLWREIDESYREVGGCGYAGYKSIKEYGDFLKREDPERFFSTQPEGASNISDQASSTSPPEATPAGVPLNIRAGPSEAVPGVPIVEDSPELAGQEARKAPADSGVGLADSEGKTAAETQSPSTSGSTKRRRGPKPDDEGHKRIATILPDDWEADLTAALKLLDPPADGGPPILPSPAWCKMHSITRYSEVNEAIGDKEIRKHLSRRRN